MKLKVTIEYDGTDYCGWQRQGELRTVQSVLENAFEVYINSQLKKNSSEAKHFKAILNSSGRTDSGVHAKGQVATMRLPLNYEADLYRLKHAINGICPRDLAIRDLEIVEDTFDARFTPHIKQYSYCLLFSRGNEGFYKDRAWRVSPKLNLPEMMEASKYFVGNHDFTSFRALDCAASTSIRTVELSELSRFDDKVVYYHIQGKGFLKQMVRIIVGTLVRVGEGVIKPKQIPEIMAAKDRFLAGKTAPAKGLVLDWVRYF